MSCRSCAERRKRLQAKRLEKKQANKPIQAAAIGAVLAVTEAAGKALGIGEETNERDGQDSGSTESGS
jgi:elongation factor P--beta-lysine ligase